MRYFFSFYLLGIMLIFLAGCMLLPLCFSIYFSSEGLFPIFLSINLCLGVGFILFYSFKGKHVKELRYREGILTVVLIWISICLFGALPYFFSRHIPHISDCLFESVSGFTTTGASILTNIEGLPKALLVWRDMTQWIGGMGMVVLALAILPFIGSGGMQLYWAEVPGPVEDKLHPRIMHTTQSLWKVYVFITIIGIMLLYFGGMNFWESMCNVFGAISTGGFNPRNSSIASYHSLYVDIVIIALMFAGGINFSLHFWLFKGKPLKMLKDPEWRFYAVLLALVTGIITLSNYTSGLYSDFLQALRYSAFQVVSIGTATGFATADYELWPPLSQMLLLLSMFGIGCAGSTSGGIKSIRTIFLLKSAYREIRKLVHPQGIFPVKVKGRVVSRDVQSGIRCFFILYIAIVAIATALLAETGEDLITAFSAVLSSMGGVGPGLGAVGPTDNYFHLSMLAKWVLMFCMLLGRLEIYSILVLLIPNFWRP